MNIGDRVRLKRGTEEGVITRFLSAQQVEVEIEDGFRIPFAAADLVLVSTQESAVFGTKAKASANDAVQVGEKNAVLAEKGIFLVMTHQNDKQLEVHLINNTDFQLLFSLGQEEERQYHGLTSGILEKRSYRKVHELNLDKFERWGAFLFRSLLHTTGYSVAQEPLNKRLVFRANTFFKSMREAPLIPKKGYVFQIDEAVLRVSAEELKNSMQQNQEAAAFIAPSRNEVAAELDLHIEALGEDPKYMSNAEILTLQLGKFEEHLDRAIAAGLDSVVFIHGVGNGKLRDEIHRKAGRHPHVASFEDAQKERFGYGATRIYIK